MKMNPFPRISRMTPVGVLALAGACVLGFGPAVQADGRGSSAAARFEGTWVNDVEIVACAPAPPIVFAAFQSMITHIPGGTLIEGGSPSAGPPLVTRSAGHGIWQRTGGHTFLQMFLFHGFDDLGRRVTITEVTSRTTLVRGDNPATPDVIEPYYLRGSGTNRITTLNPDDGTVINVTEGCNRATSAPFLFPD
jgi:hypothetical protein